MAAMSTVAGAASLPAIGTVTSWEGCSEAYQELWPGQLILTSLRCEILALPGQYASVGVVQEVR